MSGKLFGADLTAEGVIAAGTTPRYVACPVGDTVRMSVRAHREVQVKRLDARLLVAGCPECEPLDFVAVRPRHYE